MQVLRTHLGQVGNFGSLAHQGGYSEELAKIILIVVTNVGGAALGLYQVVPSLPHPQGSGFDARQGFHVFD